MIEPVPPVLAVNVIEPDTPVVAKVVVRLILPPVESNVIFGDTMLPRPVLAIVAADVILTAVEPLNVLLTLTPAPVDVRSMVAAVIAPLLETAAVPALLLFVKLKVVPAEELPATFTPVALLSLIVTEPVELAVIEPAVVVLTSTLPVPALRVRV